jgi:hypothetical protein
MVTKEGKKEHVENACSTVISFSLKIKGGYRRRVDNIKLDFYGIAWYGLD